MLHFVHKLVANFVFLLFGAGQVGGSRVLLLFFAKNSCFFSAAESDIDESGESESKQ